MSSLRGVEFRGIVVSVLVCTSHNHLIKGLKTRLPLCRESKEWILEVRSDNCSLLGNLNWVKDEGYREVRVTWVS